MGDRLQMLKDMGINLYGLGENVASLGSAAIAEPVAGFAAMYDPVHGAQAIREGMTYQPRGESAKMYQKGVGDFVSKLVKPVMPVIDTWKQGVDIAGRYSPVAGAALRTVPTSLGALMGAKPALQAGRQVSNSLGALQQRAIANASAPRTLNMGFRGQRGAIGTQRPLTEFEQAHQLAQRNAALPANQGGLGLAPDNTAMDRARAMGFKGEGVHYTPNDFDAFREGKGDYSAVWVTTDPKINLAAHNIGHNGEMIEGTNGMPLLFNNQKRVTATDKWDNDITSNFPDNVSELDAQKLKALGFTHGAMGTQAAILDPKNIRSRFAAFDPFNRESANLLAQYGAVAPTAGIAAYLYGQQNKDKQ